MIPELAVATDRLDAALSRLESAAERHLDPDLRRGDLELELQVMGEDRARLATDLEGATARIAQLETASEHVGRRVEAAMAGIEGVLGGPSAERQA